MDLSSLFDLTGRTAIVTGGSRGIGRMISEGLLSAGATVYITARKAEACDATAEELSEFGTCISLPCDLSDPESLMTFVRQFSDRETSLDILVNNAGAAWGAPFDEFPEHGWDKVMDLNLKAPFFLTQQLTPMLTKAHVTNGHQAKVINIASIDGLSLNPMETFSYHASKAGMIHLTRRMAVTLAPRGIVVSAIAPAQGVSASTPTWELLRSTSPRTPAITWSVKRSSSMEASPSSGDPVGPHPSASSIPEPPRSGVVRPRAFVHSRVAVCTSSSIDPPSS